MIDVVALNSDHAFNIREILNSIVDIRSVGDADCDSGNDAVVVNQLSLILLDRF